MQKLLIGCGAVILIVGAVCCGGFFWLSFQVSRAVSGWAESFEALAQLDERYPYELPEERTLDPVRLDDYLDARAQVVEELTRRNEIARAFLQGEPETVEQMNPLQFLREMLGLLGTTTQTIESALDARQMSLREAGYIIQTSYLTMFLGAEAGDERMESIFDQLIGSAEEVNRTLDETGTVEQQDRLEVEEAIEQLRRLRETVPQENFDLIAERRERFLEYPAIAYLEFLVLMGMENGEFELEVPAEVEEMNLNN